MDPEWVQDHWVHLPVWSNILSNTMLQLGIANFPSQAPPSKKEKKHFWLYLFQQSSYLRVTVKSKNIFFLTRVYNLGGLFVSPPFIVNRRFTFRDIWETNWPNEIYSHFKCRASKAKKSPTLYLQVGQARTLVIPAPVDTETEGTYQTQLRQSNPIRTMQNIICSYTKQWSLFYYF